jgi:hypothetical protein
MGWTSAEQSDPHTTSGSTHYTFPQAQLVGNLSCASASCHAAGEERRPGSEYSTWVNSDPHFRAYDVLFNATSRRIAKTLDVHRPGGKLLPAHENATCLKCHAPDLVRAAHPQAAQGVGCESCHGPAEKWLTTHYQDSFKSLSRREKAERYGLYPTKDLAFRVTKCASCHVGDATREVNHDLIAAGHPRLAFEYTGYHRSPKYTPHWQEVSPDFEARAWEIGQIVCARSAAELLRVRATQENAPWPELSEYSCFACHKDLTGERWKPFVASGRKPGAMPWGTWYFSVAELADPECTDEVKELIRVMESPGRNRVRAAEQAQRLVRHLDRRLVELQQEGMPPGGPDIEPAFRRIARHALNEEGTRFRDADWDGATQHYLAAAAFYSAWGSQPTRDPRPREPLRSLGRSLAFPKGYNSPKDADPAKVLDLFRQLRTPEPNPPGTR